jgi:protein O-mannosyl-transferase
LLRQLALVALVLAVLACYASSFDGAFVFDDIPAILENPHVRSLLPLRQSLSAPAEVTTAGRPAAAFSFAVSFALGGGYDTWMFHATNVAIHVLAALVLFGVVRRTLLAPPLRDRFGPSSATIALLVALLWAVHPLQTQAVTYLVQRVESLMGLFLLLTLYCSIRAAEISRLKTEAKGSAWIALAVLSCALGMATKQTMVGAPLLVVLWDWLFAERGRYRRLLAKRWPLYAGLASTWLLLAYLVASEPRPHSIGSIDGWTPLRYLATQPGVILHYLRLAIWPSPLVFDYDWPPAHGAAAVAAIAIVGALAAVTGFGLLRRHPAAFAGAWFFVILAPSSSVLPIATEVAAEHRMYLPLAAVIALVVIVTWALATSPPPRLVPGGPPPSKRVRKGPPRRLREAWVPALAIGVAVVFGIQTAARNRDYASDEQIWIDTIAKQPDNARARNNYAVDLLQAGNFAAAETHARAAIALRPATAEAHKTLGVALVATGRSDEGIAELQRATELDPDDGSAYRNLGEAYGARGDLASAARAFTQAAHLLPDDPFVLNRAGWLLATAPDAGVRNGAAALSMAQHAVELTRRRDVTSLDTLAAAHAQLGQFDLAIAVAAEALALARTTGQAAMIPELEQRLAQYRSRAGNR